MKATSEQIMTPQGSQEIDLNALSAAAPQLLSACKLAFQRSIERSESSVKWTTRDQNAHEALKAAIIKAEGA